MLTMIPDTTLIANDLPLHFLDSNYLSFSFSNDFLKLDIPLIRLVSEANLLQKDYAIEKQIEMGYASFVMILDKLLEEGMCKVIFFWMLYGA